MALPQQTRNELTSILGEMGLGTTEREVLLLLLQSEGAQRVSLIAKKLKLNRVTLYSVLKSLSERALVSSVEDRGVLAYRSIEPHLLADYLERMREKLAANIEKVRGTLPLIERERSKFRSIYPSMQFFEGVEGIKQAYEDTIKNNPSKNVYAFLGTDAIYKTIDAEWLKRYLTRRTKAGITWHAAVPDEPNAHEVQKRDAQESRVTKLLPPGYRFDIEMAAYGDRTLIASFSEDHPLAIIIKDEKIARTIREVFRYVDSTLK